ncbi:hypothetical protein [Enterococcus gallinarum]|uniref:Uncharacterized protein n=1 Tax=Enterococcus gallinarum TaxID=1353 RepID=A0ABD4ZWJ4_ENTGA|nr:hypothetical protein [Enterococcus gallinarum]MBF0724505.1 hypothetical protein [Enterococcus gallinarum]MBX8979625.1 hypothetical protein [Enterococcus gallinarum]MCR1933013.1 hypothetical protein [Enterococcus gallinarum]MCR1946126.1 hypothetical protein [Enterococcus gallinarum]MDL4876606.1 hypothetical protein [Enterococcus gallinarum]
MKEKDIHLEIVKLTEDPEWIHCAEIVAHMQELSKKFSTTRQSPTNYNAINGIKVVYSNGSHRIYPSLKQCVLEEKLCNGTIQRVVRMKSKTSDGRQFIVI